MSNYFSEISLDKKFLVTGVAGFIGSNLAEELLKRGFKVRGIDNFSNGKKENVDRLSELFSDFEFIEGDIRDYAFCSIISKNIDFVLHQAAIGSVPRSIKDPLIYESNNVQGTSNMMEASRQNNVKRFVFASSSSVFGDSNKLPKIEGEEGLVMSPYALSKKVTELYGEMYTSVFGLKCIGLRYFNVFGRNQNPDSQYAAVIPKFIKAMKNNEKINIFGDGNQSRDFTYIDNVIQANIKACISDDESCGRSYNIAYGERFTINQISKMLAEKLNSNTNIIYKEKRMGDVSHSLASIKNAETHLNYKPEWDFNSGLDEAVKWYIDNI